MKNISKIYVLSIVAISSSIFAQDFDPEFLNSLPPEIAQDLIKKAENRAKAEEAYYRPPGL